MHYTNDNVSDYLKGLGAKLVAPVQYCKIRDSNGKETPFFNGDRYTFAEATQMRNHPLPPWVLMGDCIARVKHFGQTPKATECNNCFSKDHPIWNCKNQRACRVCKQQGHLEGTEACDYYCEDNYTLPFGGRSDPLSNFYPCQFIYKKITYETREQCIQHQKALYSKCSDVADAIMKTPDPGQAKTLSKCIQKSQAWEEAEMDVYEDLCYNAAQQNDKYYNCLIDTEDQILVEAVHGQFKWGSGLSHRATGHTMFDKLPGENRMGKVHMAVRKRLMKEKVNDDIADEKDADDDGEDDNDDDKFLKPKKTVLSQHNTVQELELSIENRFQELVNKGDIELDTSSTSNATFNFGKGVGRGRGWKRDRPTSSPGSQSDSPPLKQNRDGPTPPPNKSTKTFDTTDSKKGHITLTTSQQSLIPHFYGSSSQDTHQNNTSGETSVVMEDESLKNPTLTDQDKKQHPMIDDW